MRAKWGGIPILLPRVATSPPGFHKLRTEGWEWKASILRSASRRLTLSRNQTNRLFLWNLKVPQHHKNGLQELLMEWSIMLIYQIDKILLSKITMNKGSSSNLNPKSESLSLTSLNQVIWPQPRMFQGLAQTAPPLFLKPDIRTNQWRTTAITQCIAAGSPILNNLK